MQYPERPKDKSSDASKDPLKSWVLRVDRAAHDLNPVLVVMVVGLLVLNLTLYIGMAAAGEHFTWMAPHQVGDRVGPATASSSPAFNDGTPVGN